MLTGSVKGMEAWIVESVVDWLIGQPGQVLGAVAAILALMGYLLGWWKKLWALWKGRRAPKKAQIHPSAPLVSAVHDLGSEKRRRSGTRLVNAVNELLKDVTAVAEDLKTGSVEQANQRDKRMRAVLKELVEDLQPLLLDMGDLEGEERARRTIRELGLGLPPALDFRPVSVISADDDEEDWAKLYKQMRDELEALIPGLKELKGWMKKQADVAPLGEWKPSHERKIRNDYFRDKVAHCPEDGAMLAIEADHSGSNKLVVVFCPNCERSAEMI